jgi:hypothetical protein
MFSPLALIHDYIVLVEPRQLYQVADELLLLNKFFKVVHLLGSEATIGVRLMNLGWELLSHILFFFSEDRQR